MWLAGTFHRYFLINTEMLSLVTFLKRMQRSLFIIPIKLRVYTACHLKHIFLYCTACRCDLSLRLILKIHQLHQFFSLHLSHFFLVTLALSNDIKTIHADSVWDVALGSKTILSFSHSVVSHSVTPCTAARQASLSFPISWSLLRLTSIESVMPSKHLILCRPLLLSIFLSIRVFSSESTLCTRWPQYWSFRFSVSPCNESSALISFWIEWFYLQSKAFSRQMRLRDRKLCSHPSLVPDHTSDPTAIKNKTKQNKTKNPNQVLWSWDMEFFKAEVPECLSLLAKQ